MRKEPQQQRSQQMVKTILQAALDVIYKQGFEATTTRKIAERAGISVGTLYHYYKDKDDIYQALQQLLATRLEHRIRAEIPSLVQKDFGTAVRQVLLLFMDELERDGGRSLAFAHHLMQRRYAQDIVRIERVMMEMAMQFTIAHPEMIQVRELATVTTILFNAVAFNLLRYLDAQQSPMTREQLIDGLADMCVAYVNSQLPDGQQIQ